VEPEKTPVERKEVSELIAFRDETNEEITELTKLFRAASRRGDWNMTKSWGDLLDKAKTRKLKLLMALSKFITPEQENLAKELIERLRAHDLNKGAVIPPDAGSSPEVAPSAENQSTMP